ncbi:MAG: competence/damage-inducible protein A [Halobacteriaceae archaeon]
MQASIITVGDELLAGDVTDTNASWLAARLDDRGVTVGEMLTVPDDVDAVADAVRDHRERFDATVVTGGVGGTPDDVTMDGVARAFGVDLAVDPAERERIAAAYGDRDGLDLDVDAWARTPVGARALSNPEGLSPGCVLDGVYVLPGVPAEMRAMFETVAAEFAGEVRSRSLYVTGPESSLVETLNAARERFDVAVGCYPAGEVKRVKLRGESEAALDDAADWLADALADRLADAEEWEAGREQ